MPDSLRNPFPAARLPRLGNNDRRTYITVAFQGIEALEAALDVQVHIADSGGDQFNIVGLADKAVAESKERVRAALAAIGLALPFKRITVNLAPADLPGRRLALRSSHRLGPVGGDGHGCYYEAAC